MIQTLTTQEACLTSENAPRIDRRVLEEFTDSIEFGAIKHIVEGLPADKKIQICRLLTEWRSKDTSDFPFMPSRDIVIVKKEPDLDMTPGGIHLVKGSEQKLMQGVIIAQGPGRILDNGKLAPMYHKVGDRVVYSAFANEKMAIGFGPDYRAILDADIMGVVEGE